MRFPTPNKIPPLIIANNCFKKKQQKVTIAVSLKHDPILNLSCNVVKLFIIGRAKQDSLMSLNRDFGVYIYICMAKFKEVNVCPLPEAT